MKRSFQTALRRAGIEDFRFHDLRYTSCSHLTMRGAPIQAVQDHAGHSSIKMTMRYSHLSPQFQRESIQLLNGLCVDVSKPSEANSERIVKKGHKNKEVRQPESPNLSLSLVELNGIELGGSRCGTTESIPTRDRPSACRSDRSPFFTKVKWWS